MTVRPASLFSAGDSYVASAVREFDGLELDNESHYDTVEEAFSGMENQIDFHLGEEDEDLSELDQTPEQRKQGFINAVEDAVEALYLHKEFDDKEMLVALQKVQKQVTDWIKDLEVGLENED